jgi:fluoride exporter
MSVALEIAEKLRTVTGNVGITYLCVALGSALGGSARYAISSVVASWIDATFPWGTLFVNISGCFIIGVFSTLIGPNGTFLVPANARLFLMVGICGGYTTFSSFSLEALNLARNGEWLGAGGYVMASSICCLIGVWLGHVAGMLSNR